MDAAPTQLAFLKNSAGRIDGRRRRGGVGRGGEHREDGERS